MNRLELLAIRYEYSAQATISDWFVNGNRVCYGLEDTVRPRGIKVPKHTAIPAGTYKVGIRYSPRFKREMPIIYTEDDGVTIIKEGVSFKYAQIHGGNTHENTEGCPLVAYKRVNDHTIQGTAEKEITQLVKDALDQGEEVTLKIVNQSNT